MYAVATHGPICASCRLRATIVAKQLARSKRSSLAGLPRIPFSTSVPQLLPRVRPARSIPRQQEIVKEEYEDEGDLEAAGKSLAERVLQAREKYGDALPPGVLNEQEEGLYVRLFGEPLPLEQSDQLDGRTQIGTGVLRMAQDGALEEIEYEEESRKQAKKRYDQDVYTGIRGGHMADQIPRSSREDEIDEDVSEEDEDDPTQRTHPLTAANRFGTFPTTLALPKASFVDPATLLLSGIPNVHLAQAAHRIFGGVGLPYSSSTPTALKTMQQKAIALDAFQDRMSDIEADAYMATVMPAVLASVTSVLTETRKRLGTAWAEEMVRKAVAGELRILDAGGAGAGVLAVREVLRAEWERMHEQDSDVSPMALAEADGRMGGAAVSPPLGRATVLTGSDALRKRASQLLENTTFIPRLPDYIHGPTAQQHGKFDIIIAPHTLWPLREDYIRRVHTHNLWSLLKQDSGVLLLLEKGVSRGFELIASARDLLLDTRISSPQSRAQNLGINDPPQPHVEWEGEPSPLEQESQNAEPEPLTRTKDKGMIIAPCTNHTGCPMYVQKGMVKGRKDICHFEQRYVRPSFLQKILGARDKNFEDVKFSYLAVMRGRDLREGSEDEANTTEAQGAVVQGKEASERSFEGWLEVGSEAAPMSTAAPHSLSLPRAILPPLKRRGHVILDMCTPSGTIERWTVPRSYSKQAYRDARKAQWGDLWALGAKTRVLRTIRKNKHDKGHLDVKLKKKSDADESNAAESGDTGIGVDEYGRIVVEKSEPGDHGQVRTRKVKGIRDKRDKSGKGNGRKKHQKQQMDD